MEKDRSNAELVTRNMVARIKMNVNKMTSNATATKNASPKVLHVNKIQDLMTVQLA